MDSYRCPGLETHSEPLGDPKLTLHAGRAQVASMQALPEAAGAPQRGAPRPRGPAASLQQQQHQPLQQPAAPQLQAQGQPRTPPLPHQQGHQVRPFPTSACRKLPDSHSSCMMA